MAPQKLNVLDLWPSWELSLRARNRSAATIRNYRVHLHTFADWLETGGRPTSITKVETPDIEAFIVDQIDRLSVSTAATRFRCLRVFFNWAESEQEIDSNPMSRMVPPKLEEPEVPVFSDDELRRLIAACDGNGFAERRDAAMIRLLIDAGLRSAEIMGLTLTDVFLASGEASVTGKGAKGRTVAFGNKTAQAIDRYLRSRNGHKHAEHPPLWLGVRGPLGTSGLTQMLRRRGLQADVEDVHPHRFRHTWAHKWLAAGGQEGDLQALAGWESNQMIGRYGASAKAERARDAHRKLGLGDLL